MKKTYIGIDNGVTGSIGVIGRETLFSLTPVKNEQSYTKQKQTITRLDGPELIHQLCEYTAADDRVLVVIERPMVNPKRFKATASALRCLEATLVVLESLSIPYEYIDSKEWQKVMLPKGIKGTSELKKASLDMGKRLFPDFSEEIEGHGDADGLLIAEWAKRINL